MATYSQTVSFNIPEIDLTQKLDVSISTSRATMGKINAFLAEVDRAFQAGAPYPERFDFLDRIESEKLPFTSVDFKTVIEGIPIDNVNDYILLLAGICGAFPEIRLEGISAAKPYFDIIMAFKLSSEAGSKTLAIEQDRIAAKPGATRVPDPVIEGEGRPADQDEGASPQEPAAIDLSAVLPNGEPVPILANDKVNPLSIVWLLQRDLLTIRYHTDEGRHRASMITYSGDFKEKAVGYSEKLDEIGQAPFDLLAAVTSDDFSYAHGFLHRAFGLNTPMPEGDVAIFFMLLLCRSGAWELEAAGPDEYRVTVDDLVLRGIPSAEDLIARLMWTMRDYAGITSGFSIDFQPAELERFEELFGEIDREAFDAEPAPQPRTRKYSSKPTPEMPSVENRPFDGGRSKSTFDSSEPMLLNDEETFRKNLRRLIRSFPISTTMHGGEYETENAMRRMKLAAGDLVTLSSVWYSDEVRNVAGFVVGINAHDRTGKLLGSLAENPAPWEEHAPDDFGYRELACILPYVTANVAAMSDESDEALVNLTLAFDPKGKSEDEIVAEACKLMRFPYEHRSRLSRGPIVASQVEMRWPSDRLAVEDVANPAPAGADNPHGPRRRSCDHVLAIIGGKSALRPAYSSLWKNAYADIERTRDGRYSNPDEVKQARSLPDLFKATWRDVREHFNAAIALDPTVAHIRKSSQINCLEGEKDVAIVMCYKTWGEPNTADVRAFVENRVGEGAGFALVSMLEGDTDATAVAGARTADGGATAAFENAVRIAPERLEGLRTDLRAKDFASMTAADKALRIALLEILGGQDQIALEFVAGSSFSSDSDGIRLDMASHDEFQSEPIPETTPEEPLAGQTASADPKPVQEPTESTPTVTIESQPKPEPGHRAKHAAPEPERNDELRGAHAKPLAETEPEPEPGPEPEPEPEPEPKPEPEPAEPTDDDIVEAALAEHERIVGKFNDGRRGIKSPQFTGGAYERICMHLLETGGGLTPAELLKDLNETCDKEWTRPKDNNVPIDINAILKYMKAPGTAINLAFGGFDYEFAVEANKQYTVRERDGLIYLWCQDGVDHGARIATARDLLAKAQTMLDEARGIEESAAATAHDVQDSIDRLTDYRAEARELEGHIKSLGLFKMKEKRPLKDRLETVNHAIARLEKRVGAIEARLTAAKQAVTDLEGTVETAKATYEQAKQDLIDSQKN